jgi:PAS domain S-box-containing protein
MGVDPYSCLRSCLALRLLIQESMIMSDNENYLKVGSEAQYHLMIGEVEDYAILMLDRGGNIRTWNRGAEKIKGYKEEEILGQHFRVFYTAADQEAGLPERLIAEAKEKGKALHEGWRARKNGTRFWGSIVITALHDDEGNVIGFSKVTRDLTERKLAEDRLLHNSRLLAAQNRELQQFAYIAAHDMKEPLRKIQTYMDAVLSDKDGVLSNLQRKWLSRAAASSGRMQTLITDLLAYTNVAEQSGQTEPTDLGALVQDVFAFQSDTLEGMGAVVEIGQLPVVAGIPHQLTQVFTNLLSNSIKYRDEGRVLRISVGVERLTLTPQGEEFYKISFTDNGIGFPPDMKDRIFDLFERLHGREKYPGTGLGLAICKRVMENHRGSIEAEGRRGEGSSFYLYFPVTRT